MSIIMIIANGVTLGLSDPCSVRCEQRYCLALEMVEKCIFLFFTTEMLLKMLAMGVFGKKSYLADTWNCFDSFIVGLSLLEYVFLDADVHLSAIRSLRVLRPLRAINRISSLRLLVTLILDILPMLSNVMIFFVFIFFIFGIISVQLWSGVLRQRCYFPLGLMDGSLNKGRQCPPSFMPPYYTPSGHEYVCTRTGGMQTCDLVNEFEKHSSMCVELFASDVRKLRQCRKWVGNYTECRPEADNPGQGTINFDNIFYASLAIFQVISLEGWVGVMYLIQDAFSFWSWIYFFLLVLLGSYFAVKLCLVVIAAQFSITRIKEQERMQRERRLCKPVHKTRLQRIIEEHSAPRPNRCQEDSLYLQILDLISYTYTVIFLTITNFCIIRGSRQPPKKPKMPKSNMTRLAESYFDAFRMRIRHLIGNELCQAVLACAIILNAIVMGTEHYGQPEGLTYLIEISNLIFTLLFFTELVLLFIAYGPKAYVRESFNVLDTIVISLNLIELASKAPSGSGLSVLRLFRLFRLVKILRFFPSLQRQLILMLHTVDNVASFFLLFGFLLYIFALLGMNLFGCKFCPTASNDTNVIATETLNWPHRANCSECQFRILTNELLRVPRGVPSKESHVEEPAGDRPDAESNECAVYNFDTLSHSISTVLQIFTGDDWGAVMENGMYYTNHWASIYFVVLVTIGDYIIFNLLIGILVEGFSMKHEEELSKQINLFSISVPRSIVFERSQVLRWIRMFFSGFGSQKALFIFSPDNACRRWLKRVLSTTVYDTISLFFTLASCVIIMLERPSIAPDSSERMFLTISGYIFFVMFLLEAIAKIIADGFILGKVTYLRSGWNILDFCLLLLAAVDIVAFDIMQSHVGNKLVVHALRPVRLLRALRPLRLISRAEGLKVVLQTLALSIMPIGHIVLICCFFFVIFAILGVQLFSGCYSTCAPPRQFGNRHVGSDTTTMKPANSLSEAQLETLINSVNYRNECISLGLEWETESYNFDSLPNALMTLFVFATLDGWTEIAHNGANCAGPDLQPKHGSNSWSSLFFMSFLLIVCFFALNMFVGVIVNNFQKVQRKLEQDGAFRVRVVRSEKLLKRLSRRFFHQPKKRRMRSVNALPPAPYWATYPSWRIAVFKFVNHKHFDVAVMFVVLMNVVTMAMEHHQMSPTMRKNLTLAGNLFMLFLFVELAVKLVALGCRRYVQDSWNRLDLGVTIFSALGFILEHLGSAILPPTIVWIARAFRIARVAKLWRAARPLHHLLRTISKAIPQVINLSLLFVLLFFIYASLGVQLYGKFDCTFESCEGLSLHANFAHFGMALLTLFRVFTGDGWNLILKDVLRLSQSPLQCQKVLSDNGNVAIPCGLVQAISPLYFVSFVLLAQFVLINIVVAVLMQQIENIHKSEFDPAKIDFEEKDVIRVVEKIEARAIDIIVSSPTADNLLSTDGFDVADLVSIVSTDYVIRRELCDADYIASRLVTTDDVLVELIPASNSVGCGTQSHPAETTNASNKAPTTEPSCAAEDDDSDELVSSAVPSTLPVDSAAVTTRLFKSQQQQQQKDDAFNLDATLWQALAVQIQSELARSPSRAMAISSFIETRTRRLSSSASTSALTMTNTMTNRDNDDNDHDHEDCSYRQSGSFSDNLSEYSSSQFDTWR